VLGLAVEDVDARAVELPEAEADALGEPVPETLDVGDGLKLDSGDRVGSALEEAEADEEAETEPDTLAVALADPVTVVGGGCVTDGDGDALAVLEPLLVELVVDVEVADDDADAEAEDDTVAVTLFVAE
jgi:hypothetical protein